LSHQVNTPSFRTLSISDSVMPNTLRNNDKDFGSDIRISVSVARRARMLDGPSEKLTDVSPL